MLHTSRAHDNQQEPQKTEKRKKERKQCPFSSIPGIMCTVNTEQGCCNKLRCYVHLIIMFRLAGLSLYTNFQKFSYMHPCSVKGHRMYNEWRKNRNAPPPPSQNVDPHVAHMNKTNKNSRTKQSRTSPPPTPPPLLKNKTNTRTARKNTYKFISKLWCSLQERQGCPTALCVTLSSLLFVCGNIEQSSCIVW